MTGPQNDLDQLSFPDRTAAKPVEFKMGKYKWELLVLLWVAFFLNQADRQIFGVVLPMIKADLHLTDGELGLISSTLVWTYGALVVVAGFIGDRFSRRNIIGICLLLWSIATLTTGLCTTLIQFIFLRGIATGGGEAFYAPAANALITEQYRQKRSFALSVHQSAVYIGIILSAVIAGAIAERYGWRASFYSFGGFGIITAIILFIRIRKDIPVIQVNRIGISKSAGVILRKPTFIFLSLAFAAVVFVNVGYLTWMPSLLVEKFDLSLSSAGFSSMFYHHIGAFTGVIIGGLIADRLTKWDRKHRLTVQAIALLIGTPFIYWMGAATNERMTYIALFFFGLAKGAYDSNIFAALFEIVPSRIRSSASGIMLMFAFITGATSPYLLGILKPTLGLSAGLSWLWVMYLLGGALLLIAMLFTFGRDMISDKNDHTFERA